MELKAMWEWNTERRRTTATIRKKNNSREKKRKRKRKWDRRRIRDRKKNGRVCLIVIIYERYKDAMRKLWQRIISRKTVARQHSHETKPPDVPYWHWDVVELYRQTRRHTMRHETPHNVTRFDPYVINLCAHSWSSTQYVMRSDWNVVKVALGMSYVMTATS